MKILDVQLCKRIAGAYSLTIQADGSATIRDFKAGDVAIINNLQFTDHGYFDLQGNKVNPYNVNGFNVIDGYQIKMVCLHVKDPEMGFYSLMHQSYQLLPV